MFSISAVRLRKSLADLSIIPRTPSVVQRGPVCELPAATVTLATAIPKIKEIEFHLINRSPCMFRILRLITSVQILTYSYRQRCADLDQSYPILLQSSLRG